MSAPADICQRTGGCNDDCTLPGLCRGAPAPRVNVSPSVAAAALSAHAKLAALSDSTLVALALQTIGELHRRALAGRDALEPLVRALTSTEPRP